MKWTEERTPAAVRRERMSLPKLLVIVGAVLGVLMIPVVMTVASQQSTRNEVERVDQYYDRLGCIALIGRDHGSTYDQCIENEAAQR